MKPFDTRQLSSVSKQIKTLLNLSFSTSGEEKSCIDEILYNSVNELCHLAASNQSLTQHPQPAAATSYTPYAGGKTIAFRIRLARENLNMSEDDLAEKLDIHPGDVLAWEDSTDQPLAGMIIPLANALKCDPLWLLTGETVNSQGLSGKQLQPASQRVDALSREVPQR
ncbi:hypothetical protein AO411_2029035 [Salmonella enterica subsp. enterica serovar Sarajane]|nr:hypothetical protein AO411_2029035 [Salmonella enterica subsp. enterica serovar Sarajane]